MKESEGHYTQSDPICNELFLVIWIGTAMCSERRVRDFKASGKSCETLHDMIAVIDRECI